MPARSRQIGDGRRALEINPQSVEARIGIGTLLVDDVVLRFTTSREQDVARADQLLQEALAREMNISMAHFAMGVLRRIQVRLNDSQIELQAAIALDRNNARAYQQLGLTLMWLGQPDAAIPQIKKAIRLNPTTQTSPVTTGRLVRQISSLATWMTRPSSSAKHARQTQDCSLYIFGLRHRSLSRAISTSQGRRWRTRLR
jgi:tetratricopeptide (TPR) repeat protein